MTTLHISDQEFWKDIPGYEGFYQASNLGRIKSLSRIVNSSISHSGKKKTKERLINIHLNRGYQNVALCREGRASTKKVHRLVMEAWRGKQDLDVNHIDGNKENNNLSNLEYCSHADNMSHAYKNGKYRRNIIQCKNTGKSFNSIKEAAESLGIKRETLSSQLHGIRKNKTSLKIIKYATNK